ncbi:hypothetical protein C8R43DRAFT_996466 [Mycena crocata]|nr:hypothetical protein C8R43DRAFT_996466 [Mycena crocata]
MVAHSQVQAVHIYWQRCCPLIVGLLSLCTALGLSFVSSHRRKLHSRPALLFMNAFNFVAWDSSSKEGWMLLREGKFCGYDPARTYASCGRRCWIGTRRLWLDNVGFSRLNKCSSSMPDPCPTLVESC